jgi:O-antigen ligase
MREAETASKPRANLRPLELIVYLHFGTMLLFTSWAFGGQAPWARQIISWAGSVGIALFLWISLRFPRQPSHPSHPALRLLWPLGVYDLIVIVSCFNPGFREMVIGGETSLVMADPIPWLPTAARPLLAARELWQFNGIVLTCFNLYLVLRRRRQVRSLLFLAAGNAVALAIFGTFQKLVGAKGLWFGLVPSPNPRFFSTFIYHNHWGAFTLLNTAICIALFFHYYRYRGHRDIWHSPALLWAVSALVLAMSVPLSASRSCTFLIGALLTGTLVHFLIRLSRRRLEKRQPVLLPVTGVILAALLAVGAIGYLGREAIAQRMRQTTQQLSHLSENNTLSSRLTLYRDTWHMAAQKPWFGWGLESYAHVFRIYNTQRTAETWWWIPFYARAHSDWLQSLAEVGFAGTGLLVLLGMLPLCSPSWHRPVSSLPHYLLTGCILLLLYAWLEFPFANSAVMLTFWFVFYCAIRHSELDTAATHD